MPKGVDIMKYNENNKPLICMQTTSKCYRNTYQMKVRGVLWHSTGANNPTLRRYVQPSDNDPNRQQLLNIIGTNKYNNDWNHKQVNAGLNCWIGKLADGSVTTIQTMPWNYAPWGCASGPKGSCNDGWIQFEICEDDLNDPKYFNLVYKEACEITAYLCKLYNINPLGTVNYNGVIVPTILCHSDSNKLGLGNAHADIYTWFPKYGKNMETARRDVAALLNNQQEEEEMTQEQFNKMMDNYINTLAQQPATWEQSALVWAQENGLLVGDETGKLMPKKFMTRGELATVLQRYDAQQHQ